VDATKGGALTRLAYRLYWPWAELNNRIVEAEQQAFF